MCGDRRVDREQEGGRQYHPDDAIPDRTSLMRVHGASVRQNRPDTRGYAARSRRSNTTSATTRATTEIAASTTAWSGWRPFRIGSLLE